MNANCNNGSVFGGLVSFVSVAGFVPVPLTSSFNHGTKVAVLRWDRATLSLSTQEIAYIGCSKWEKYEGFTVWVSPELPVFDSCVYDETRGAYPAALTPAAERLVTIIGSDLLAAKATLQYWHCNACANDTRIHLNPIPLEYGRAMIDGIFGNASAVKVVTLAERRKNWAEMVSQTAANFGVSPKVAERIVKVRWHGESIVRETAKTLFRTRLDAKCVSPRETSRVRLSLGLPITGPRFESALEICDALRGI
jgi:hypothetical protein